MSKKWDEKRIKTKLIDYLIEKNSFGDLICSEVPFLGGKRRVDILKIKKNSLIAYEIKSELDSLKDLPEQIEDYSNTFDKVYLVLSHKFKKIPTVHKNIGLWKFENENLIKQRIAKPKKKLKKENLSYFLWKRDLQKYTNKDVEISKLRSVFIKKHTLKEIKKIAISCLKERYGKRFELFLYDRDGRTHLEDLYLLTNKNLEIY